MLRDDRYDVFGVDRHLWGMTYLRPYLVTEEMRRVTETFFALNAMVTLANSPTRYIAESPTIDTELLVKHART